MIIDAHVHITLPKQKTLHHSLRAEDYFRDLNSVGGGKGILFANPFDSNYCCPNAFIGSSLHKSAVVNDSYSSYSIMCKKCNTIHYKGEDVFRDINLHLQRIAKEFDSYALAFLSAPSLSIQNQVDYYEEHHAEFLGYKIHPTIMMQPIDELRIESKKPVLIHSGNDEYASPQRIAHFAKSYKGKVIIAHFARFDSETLANIRNSDNVWVDMSPFTYLFGLISRKPNQLCETWGYEEKQAVDMFFELIEYVGVERVIFASDAPFGDLKKEIAFINSLGLSKSDYERIMKNNAIEAFGIKDLGAHQNFTRQYLSGT